MTVAAVMTAMTATTTPKTIEHGDSRRSRRSRRLNAQERRAAAEVEQIEEDLVLDGITYAPIDDESRNGNDDDRRASDAHPSPPSRTRQP